MAAFFPVLKTWGKAGPGGRLILLRIQHANERRYVSTGIYVKKSHWNPRKGLVRKDNLDSDKLNQRIKKRIRSAEAILTRLDLEERPISARILQELLKPNHARNDFWAFADKWRESQHEQGRFHYHRRARAVLRKFDKFAGRPLAWRRFTYSTLFAFDDFMAKEMGNHPNTRRGAFRVLGTVCSRAVKAGVIEPGDSPFIRFEPPKSAPTERVALDFNQIKMLEQLDLPQGSLDCLARDVFVTSFWLRGSRFGDTITLKWENVQDDRIRYTMSKNGKLLDLPIKSFVTDVLRRYGPPGEGYIFHDFKPGLSSDEMLLRVSGQNYVLNKRLKVVAQLSGIGTTTSTQLSMHASRHSFALAALHAGVPQVVIKDGLAHSDDATTRRYLKELDSTRLDDAFDAVGL